MSNLSLTFEYTRTNPLAFKHIIETTTYESNRFNLGHYLTDNADEIHFALSYHPTRDYSIRKFYQKPKRSRLYKDYNRTTRTALHGASRVGANVLASGCSIPDN